MSIGEKRRAAPKIPTPAVLSRFLVASGDRQLARREATGMSMPCPYVRLPRFSPFHRAVTIFATVDKEYLIMIISTAKIPSTPHNHPRASAPATPPRFDTPSGLLNDRTVSVGTPHMVSLRRIFSHRRAGKIAPTLNLNLPHNIIPIKNMSGAKQYEVFKVRSIALCKRQEFYC